MIRNQKFKYLTTTIAGVASLAFVLLLFFVYRTFPKSNPNVFLEFQYTSKDYYKIKFGSET